jgi:hypothetical protein
MIQLSNQTMIQHRPGAPQEGAAKKGQWGKLLESHGWVSAAGGLIFAGLQW